MARTDDIGSPGFIFWGDEKDGLTFEQLKQRRAIAAALAARQRGFPKTLGEGLTYFGESLGEAIGDWRLRQMERENKKFNAGQRTVPLPGEEQPPQPQQQTTTTGAPAVTQPQTPPPPSPVSQAPAPNMGGGGGAGVFPDVTMPDWAGATGGDTAAAVDTAPPAVDPAAVAPDQAAAVDPAALADSDHIGTGDSWVTNASIDDPRNEIAKSLMAQTTSGASPSLNVRDDPNDPSMPMPIPVATTPYTSSPDDPPNTLPSANAALEDPQSLMFGGTQMAGEMPRQAQAQPPQMQASIGPDTLQALPPQSAAPAPPAAPMPPQQGAPPIEGPMPDPRSQARMAAIRGIESGGSRDPYSMRHAITKTGDRAYGAYGIMGKNIPGWTKDALGYSMTPEQFLANRNAQDITFRNRFEGNYVPKYGEEGAARAWYAGERGMHNLAAKDMHGRLTVAGYGQDFKNRLGGGAEAAPVQQDNRVQMAQALTERDLASDATQADVLGSLVGQPRNGAQLASLRGSDTGLPDTATDAAPMGAVPGIDQSIQARRDAIARGIQGPQPAPVAPDPLPATAQAPGLQPGIRPDTIPGAFPQSNVFPPPPAPQQQITQAPVAPEPTLQRKPYPEIPPEPTPPPQVPMRPEQREILTRMQNPRNDPMTQRSLDNAYKAWDAERQRRQAIVDKQYEDQVATRNKMIDERRKHELSEPQDQAALTKADLENKKLRRDLEGEGFLPLTPEEMASLPKPPPGQIIYKNRRGELKFGPTPPASTTVNIDQKAQGKGLEKLEEKMAEHFVETFTQGNTAADDLQNIAGMRANATRIGTGPGAVARSFLGSVGIKTKGSSDIEAFEATIARLTPQQRVPGSGPSTDFDAHLFMKSLPGLMNTPGGNEMIMDTMEGLARNKMERAEIAGKVISRQMSIADGTREMLVLQSKAKLLSDRVDAFANPKKSDSAPATERQVPDGATRTNRSTGERQIRRGGKWEPM